MRTVRRDYTGLSTPRSKSFRLSRDYNPAAMDDQTLPLEAGIADRALSFTKGCYMGQEVRPGPVTAAP